MSRLLFFLLLIATLGLGAHLWLSANAERADFSARELNSEEVHVIAVTAPLVASRAAAGPRGSLQGLAGSPCVEFSGIGSADIARARDAFAALKLGDRLTERRVEEITRFWVFMPPAPDRRTADATLAQLRHQGVSDLSVRPDNAISLGVFSSDEAAQRFLASLVAKGVKGADAGPFVKELREIVMLVRDPDTETVARLTILQRDFPTAQLRAVSCPAK